VDLRGEVEEEDEVGRVTGGTQLTAPGAGLVERASVAASLEVLADIYWLQPDSWELNDRLPGVTVFDAASTEVPLCPLQEEPVDIDAVFWRFGDFIPKALPDVGTELELVDWRHCLSCVALQGGGHEALREEEGRHPEGERNAFQEPLAEERHSLDQVWNPGAEWLERGVADGLPLHRHLVVEECRGHILELYRHDHSSLNCLVELVEGILHHF